MELIKPAALKEGDTIGVFTPSYPANVFFREKYLHAVNELTRIGHPVIEGFLTHRNVEQGYRTAPPRERAEEFMRLIIDSRVKCLMATIGGYNSSSLLPFLDYDQISKHPKIIIGYSDITSLHMAILTQSRLSTFYGPALVPSFGEWPHILSDTLKYFRNAVSLSNKDVFPQDLGVPKEWSNHFRNALNDDWKTIDRKYKKNNGWIVLSSGKVTAPIILANLNTLVSLAGTKFFPSLNGCILLLEEQDATISLEERSFRQLQLMGVFDDIVGLIIGKPESLDLKNAPFGYSELIMEVVGPRNYPIVFNFDCGHTHPMITLAQGTIVSINAYGVGDVNVSITIDRPMVTNK
ncbi:MAG: LD-carboxypeptidase [Clostridiales Family XIII bacterium]|jgi:muramoyltetrapeptide carboxypeptidase LdcA involved in peptidoglycan recycling|nr:LD-carboxypeptidase [Clostridiales Family XIII bacterium]